jgi:hypothetical protein
MKFIKWLFSPTIVKMNPEAQKPKLLYIGIIKSFDELWRKIKGI